MPFGSWPLLVIQGGRGMIAPRELKVATSKILVIQWRNAPPCCHRLAHHLAFTKSAQEPECGHEMAMFSGRAIDVLGQLQLGIALQQVFESGERSVRIRGLVLPTWRRLRRRVSHLL